MSDRGLPPAAVIVISWNTRDLLRRCLDSLVPAHQDGTARVVVVDNDSVDGSAEMVDHDFPWTTLIRSGANLGFGRAVNLGASAAEGVPWLIAANADIEVPGGAIRDLLEVGKSSGDIAAVAPRLVEVDGTTQASVFPFPRVSTTAAAALGVHRLSPRIANRMFRQPSKSSTPQDIEYAAGAFLMFRRSAFDAVGGFDEDQWMYAEDLDICWRLARASMRTVFVPSVSVLHVGGVAAEQAFGNDVSLPVAAAYQAWLKRRRGRTVARAVALLTLSSVGLRVAAWTLLAMLGHPGATERRKEASAWLRTTRWAMSRRQSSQGSRGPEPGRNQDWP